MDRKKSSGSSETAELDKPRPSGDQPKRGKKRIYASDDTPIVESEYRWVAPKSLCRREINARYMEPHQFRRLVDNIKADGCLTSVPLVYQHDDGELEIISGHHRTEASVEVGLSQIYVQVIVSRHTHERLTALQLSHNAVEGQDDKAKLAELYNSLGLSLKKYSGLTDDAVTGFEKIKLDGIGAASISYEEISLLFLPEEKKALEEALAHLGERTNRKGQSVHAVSADHFDLWFDVIVKTKLKMTVHNSAFALLTMAELALERLAQIEAEEAEEPAAEEPPAKKERKRK